MSKRTVTQIGIIACLLFAIGLCFNVVGHRHSLDAAEASRASSVVAAKHSSKLSEKKAKQVAAKKVKQTAAKQAATKKVKQIDWQAPSEKKAYPNPQTYSNFWIDVSTKKHRVYLMNGQKTLYTMYASTGGNSSPTPAGTYYIEAEHGDFFYNAGSGEGAKYWRSFLDHGIYLFHSVPTDQNGNFIESEAELLGKSANSHGCIRLSVADAKWFYQTIPVGTKVVIR